jgi:hypothetical protein
MTSDPGAADVEDRLDGHRVVGDLGAEDRVRGE